LAISAAPNPVEAMVRGPVRARVRMRMAKSVSMSVNPLRPVLIIFFILLLIINALGDGSFKVED
jgi:hypothetical protein